MTPHRRTTFGPFEFDHQSCELRRDGRTVALQRQPALVLGGLVAGAGRLVTRDELRAAVWAEATHVDFDRGINFCIRQLRIALQDDARAPRYIQTVARRGYRFMPDVMDATAAVTPAQGASPGGPMPRPTRWLIAAALVALVAVEAVGDSATHHRAAVQVVEAVHDLLF